MWRPIVDFTRQSLRTAGQPPRGGPHVLWIVGAVTCLCAAVSATASPIITYQVTPPGVSSPGNVYHYSFQIAGNDFFAGEELDIEFGVSQFTRLQFGQAGQDFDLLLLQPGSPPGAPGEYSALALVDNPLLTPGSFGVDVTQVGQGPVSQLPFFLYDDRASVSLLIDSGVATSAAAATPEPATLPCSAAGFLSLAIYIRRRARLQFARNY
ncbi:MAG: hypothetical protein ABJC09_05750 [Terriglobia bacterium]